MNHVPLAATVLTNVRQVFEATSYRTNEANPIELEVRCLYSDPAWGFLWLHDGNETVFVRLSEFGTPLPAGTRARIRTTTFKGSAAIDWTSARVEHLEAAGFPPATLIDKTPPASQLTQPVWGEGVGIIRKSSRYEGHAEGEIVINGQIGEFYINRGLREIELTPLATVRIRGVFHSRDQYSTPGCHFKVFIPSPSEVETVHRGLAPYFDRPRTEPGALETLPAGSRTVIQGTVAGLPGEGVIRVKSGDVILEVHSPLRVNVRPGDEIDAVGALGRNAEGFPALEGALFRQLAQTVRPDSGRISFEPVLRTTAEVRKLPKEEARRELPVALKAVVTGNYTPFGLENVFVQDETGGIYAYPGTNVWKALPGQLVEVSGVTSPGNFAPEIVIRKIEPLGPGEMPPTSLMDIKRLKSGHMDSQWIEVAGLVTRVSMFEKLPLLDITDGFHQMRVRLGSATLPTSLSNTVARFRGTASTIWGPRRQAKGAELWCPSEEFIEVEDRLDRDPFSIPVETIGTVREFKPNGFLPRWTRVRGVVTANAGDGRVVIQSGDDAIPVHSSSSDGTPPPGTMVDAVGLRRMDGNLVELYRSRLKGGDPAPLPFAPEVRVLETFPQDQGFTRRTVEGVLLGFQPGARTVVLILLGDIPFRAEFPRSPETAAFETFRPGSLLRISGALFGKSESGATRTDMHLLAASAADLSMLRAAPWWTTSHSAAAGGAILFVGLAAFGWVRSLRSKVREQSLALEERFQQTRDLERRNADLVEKAGEIVFGFDANGNITSANAVAGRLVGFKPSAMVGRPVVGFLMKQDRTRAAKKIRETIGGSPMPLLHVRCITADDGWRWIEVQLHRLADPGGGYSFGGVARDISDRKLAERARGQSSKNLHRIMESLPDAILLVDRAGSIRFKNPKVRMLLGYERGVIAAGSVSILGSPPLAAWINDLLDQGGSATKTGTGMRRTLPFMRADGSTFQADITLGVVAQGNSRMAMVCFRDAASRLAAEETLRVQALMAGTEAAVARLINTATTEDELLKGCTDIIVRRFGAAFARIWTHDRGADLLVLKASSGMYTHLDGPHSRIRVGEYKIGLIAATRDPVLTNDLPNDPRASNPEWAAAEGIRGFAGYPMLIGSELAGVLAVFFRVPPTDQIATLLSSLASAISGGIGGLRTLAALDRTSAKLHAILHSAPVAILELDPEGRISDLNPSAETLFGWRREEALGTAVEPLVKMPPGFLSLPGLRSPNGLEVFLDRKDGGKIECNVFTAPLAASAKMSEGAVCVVLDLSERRRLEAESYRIEHKLRESQRLESLGVLAGGIAHDFNNILTSILGNASLAALAVPAGTDAADCIAEIEHGSKRAAELCRLMLAYAGKGGLEKRPENVTEIVQDTLKLIRHGIGTLARVELDLDENLPPVEADAAQIRQVVMNLIANASDALGDKPGVIRIRTAKGEAGISGPPYSEMSCAGHVVFEVSDSGCGMTDEVRNKIFDPFFTTKFTGRGLGLAAVWGIVRGHDGTIGVHSTPGGGSTFRVWLPARRNGPHAIGIPSTGAVATGTIPVALAVIIDDEAPLRTVTRQILAKYGVKSVEAADGPSGLALVMANRKSSPLVFLDLTMPEMGGIEVLRRLREAAPEIPVVLMSGYSAETPYDQANGPTADAFLAKPFGAQRLAEVASEVLRGRADGA